MTRIVHRHDTSANWTSINPTLSQGEFGVEDDTGKFKIGDGQTAWNSLPYSYSVLNPTLDGKLNTDHSNDTKPYIIETYVNETSGYNVWSNGYCEQWGRFTGHNNEITITFLKEWKDINYGIYQGEIGRTGADPYVNGVFYHSFTTTSVIASLRNDGTNTYMWKAYGYLKEGQY